ncbi:MAG: hypothetical protein M1819_002873 [Sarea resinae]|nr:MAG: hypothetical protein M1819_002873 [Sarea resinae]
MSRHLRNLFSLSRLRPRYYSKLSHNDQNPILQRVHIVRPVFSKRRTQTALVYGAVLYAYWNYGIPIIFREVEEEEEHANQTRERAMEQHHIQHEEAEGDTKDQKDGRVSRRELPPEVADDDAIFIPFGWARQCPRKFYKGSDPEWQEFIKLANNRQKAQKIREDLVGMVGNQISRDKNFRRRLGQDIRVGRYWLDIDFPNAPPPEYERSGLEIGDDYIAWTIRPVTPQNYYRLHHALWPKALSSSCWASYKTLVSLQYQRVKDIFRINSKEQDDSQFGGIREKFEQQLGRVQEQKPDSNGPSGQQQPSRFPSWLIQDPRTATSSISPLSNTGMDSAFTTFAKTLAKKWRPPTFVPPRGSVILSGLVEIQGTDAMAVLDVKAAYNPKEAKWGGIMLGVRRYQRRRQAPLGGP